ncbi:MAG: TlpA family protein disulfide reductase [Alphaproteobacteria bacterium]|nr:TlpA family protein disulfide reductase [Alphaproteobacteria bacterium]
MRAGLLAAMMAMLLATAATAAARDGGIDDFNPAPAPAPMPDIPVLAPGEAGKTARLADLRGRVLVVNFWATWCAPCVAELPSLQALQAALNQAKASVVLVSQDPRGLARTEPYLEKLGIKLPYRFVDEKLKLSRALGVGDLPTTLLVDAAGREIGRLVGPADWASPEAVALVGRYIAAGN